MRAECLDWLLITGRGHLERVLHIYIEHYNGPPAHQALELESPDRPAGPTPSRGDQRHVHRRDQLGGPLHETTDKLHK